MFTRMMCPAMRGAGRRIGSRGIVAKVAQDGSSESSGSIVKYVKNSVSFLSLSHITGSLSKFGFFKIGYYSYYVAGKHRTDNTEKNNPRL